MPKIAQENNIAGDPTSLACDNIKNWGYFGFFNQIIKKASKIAPVYGTETPRLVIWTQGVTRASRLSHRPESQNISPGCTTSKLPASCLECLLIKVSGYRDVQRKFWQKVKCAEKVDLKARL